MKNFFLFFLLSYTSYSSQEQLLSNENKESDINCCKALSTCCSCMCCVPKTCLKYCCGFSFLLILAIIGFNIYYFVIKENNFEDTVCNLVCK